jgi:hypothetical protein
MENPSNQETISQKLTQLSQYISIQDIPHSLATLQEILDLKPSTKITLQKLSHTTQDPRFLSYISGTSSGNKAFNQEIYQRLLRAGNSEEDSRFGAMGTSTLPEAVQKIKTKYRGSN